MTTPVPPGSANAGAASTGQATPAADRDKATMTIRLLSAADKARTSRWVADGASNFLEAELRTLSAGYLW